MSGTARNGLGWVLAGVLVVTGLLQATGALWWGAQVLAFPFESTRPEAFIHDGVSRVLEGRPLYAGFDAWPLVLHIYNPLTYLPTAGLARLFGSEPAQILLVGRLLSYGSTLALAALLGWAGWRWTRDLRAVVLAPIALLLIHRVALTDFFRLRPESPALLFTLAGVWVVASRPRGEPYLAAVFFFVAFAIKQPFVAAPVATFLFLLAARRFADAGRFAAALGGLLAFFFAALCATTGTDYFASAIVSMRSNDVAVHLGNPEALDWFLLELLEAKGLVDLSDLFASIRRGRYATIALPTHGTSGLEPRILDAVRAGPYRLADIQRAGPHEISTFVRGHPPASSAENNGNW